MNEPDKVWVVESPLTDVAVLLPDVVVLGPPLPEVLGPSLPDAVVLGRRGTVGETISVRFFSLRQPEIMFFLGNRLENLTSAANK